MRTHSSKSDPDRPAVRDDPPENGDSAFEQSRFLEFELAFLGTKLQRILGRGERDANFQFEK